MSEMTTAVADRLQQYMDERTAQKAAQDALNPVQVAVGDGVTYGVGSDRYAATVTRVSESGKTIYFTNDVAKMAPEGDYYGNQVYTYESVPEVEGVDPSGETRSNVKSARWNAKHQRFVFFGRGLMAGRNQYSDPHF